MRFCPTCHQQFPAGSSFCPHDGHRLEPLAEMTEAGELDELLGQVLDDRYRLESRLGEGGMGVVYAARHVIIDKRVAVKILRREYSGDERQAERFLREARAASRIEHPNIVDITDFGKTAGKQIYFVMEYLLGHTLAWEIRRLRALDTGRCVMLASQICRALTAAHSKGIVHRDLKPENIFIVNPSTGDTSERSEGHRLDTIKLLDFGIAKFSWDPSGKRLTRVGSVFGTPQYMSPEQAAGQDADHRVDIYAMGCILYEMLTGELPFNADTFMGTLTKHLLEQPLAPRQLKPELGIPAALEEVILRALQKDPAQRFQTAGELAAALEAGLEAAGPTPPSRVAVPELPPPPPGPAPAPSSFPELATDLGPERLGSRGPGLLFWAPLLGLLLLGASALVWWMTQRSADRGGSARPAAGRQGDLPGAAADLGGRAPAAVTTPDLAPRHTSPGDGAKLRTPIRPRRRDARVVARPDRPASVPRRAPDSGLMIPRFDLGSPAGQAVP